MKKIGPSLVLAVTLLFVLVTMIVFTGPGKKSMQGHAGGDTPLLSEKGDPSEIAPSSGEAPDKDSLVPLSDATSTEEVLREASRESELVRQFFSAPRARLAEDVANQAAMFGSESANDWQMQLDVACNPNEIEYLSNNASTTQNVYVKKLSAYCDGFTPSHDFSRPQSLTDTEMAFGNLARNKSKHRFSKDISGLGESETNDFIVQTLRAASAPEQIYAVSDYLSEYYLTTGQVLWQPELGGTQISHVIITPVQSIALELYACKRFGGCGPDSLKMMRLCAFVPACEPRWSYEQYVFANHSPVEMEYIQRLLSHIYRG